MAKTKNAQSVQTAFNRYELSQVIGEGGAGRVWQATDTARVEVAVKVLAQERITSERQKRFKNEILFCLHAQHPNIVPVLDYGAAAMGTASSPFYVMPLLQGSLRDLMAATQDNRRRLVYFDQLLSGVEAAHLKGVVHRDLKPENILYNQSKDAVLVADFGIAHFTDEELYTAVETASGVRLANFLYSAPEQRVRGRPTNERTDIFSLGLMLNELFTGEVPHGEGYKTVASDFSDYAWVDEVVAEMIQQDPAKRPASIDAVKRQFLARQQDFVTRQRLSQIQNIVIPVGEEDDPLALDPPQIVDFEWEKGQLTLILSRPVNRDWVQAFLNMGSYASVLGVGPGAFSINDNRASVSAQSSDVQRIINYFKEWLPRATQVYRERRQAQREKVAERERANLRAEQEEIERRRRLRENIRL